MGFELVVVNEDGNVIAVGFTSFRPRLNQEFAPDRLLCAPGKGTSHLRMSNVIDNAHDIGIRF